MKQTTSQRHKHADLIHAWADGAEIQVNTNTELGWEDSHTPGWYPDFEYRIKPEEKKPVVRWLWAYKTIEGSWVITDRFYTEFDVLGTTPSIKLEWSRTEFPE